MDLPLITLTTDFGHCDGYVAAMKGVILGISPATTIVDVSHDIEPQDISQAALVVSTASSHFPPHAIHVAVVDPGVGTDRKPLLVKTENGYYIGPDNGIFTYVLAGCGLLTPETPLGGATDPKVTQVPQGCDAYIIDRSEFWCRPLSNTFHGRDLFAPVAAHLSLGTMPENMGAVTHEINVLPMSLPRTRPDRIIGKVVYVDRFGNLVTNVRMGSSETAANIEVEGYIIPGISSSYQAGQGLLAIIGSHGYLEIAWWRDSAAQRLGAGVGVTVTVFKDLD